MTIETLVLSALLFIVCGSFGFFVGMIAAAAVGLAGGIGVGMYYASSSGFVPVNFIGWMIAGAFYGIISGLIFHALDRYEYYSNFESGGGEFWPYEKYGKKDRW